MQRERSLVFILFLFCGSSILVCEFHSRFDLLHQELYCSRLVTNCFRKKPLTNVFQCGSIFCEQHRYENACLSITLVCFLPAILPRNL